MARHGTAWRGVAGQGKDKRYFEGKEMKIIKTIILVGIIGMLIFVVGTCAWQNCRKPDTGPEPPSIEKAKYSVTIKATGRTVYTNDLVNTGKVYTMEGYWETVKDKYVYRNIILTLDERVFGKIEVKKR